MTAKQILSDLQKAGSPSIKKIFINHGAVEPIYGVKVADMKLIQKKVKENKQQIAVELFESGVGDAQYLAGLMANGALMSTKQIDKWAKAAKWQMISEYSVPWVASENPEAWSLALEWIESNQETVASSGWTLLGCIVAMQPNDKLDLPALKKLMSRVETEVHKAKNRVKYAMNNFLICLGSYVRPLNKEAIDTAKKIGEVTVDMGETACVVPSAADYIGKTTARGSLDKKKKTMKC